MVKDPVCGMEVDEKTAKFTSVYKNKTYYFCSKACKEKFDNTISNLKKAGGGICCGDICFGICIEEEKEARK